MSTTTKDRRYTPEDLLAMSDAVSYELVDGRLERRAMGATSSLYGGLLYALLLTFCRSIKFGWVLPADASYQCFPGRPFMVRKPDVSVIRFGRLPGGCLPEGHIPIAPDLAVEVLSPRDLASRTNQKVQDYLQAGVSLVWILDPRTQTVQVFRKDRSTALLTEQDELTGEDVLHGFRCRVGELFPPAVEAVEAS
jgi:Uma2 family endonuclease